MWVLVVCVVLYVFFNTKFIKERQVGTWTKNYCPQEIINSKISKNMHGQEADRSAVLPLFDSKPKEKTEKNNIAK